MSDTFTETPAEKAESWTTLVAAILLGIAATLTALSAYQAALLDGEVLSHYSEANAGLTGSTFLLTTDLQTLAGDQAIFREYASAVFEGNQDLADYTYQQMSPNLQEAVDWLEATPEAVTPFQALEGNPYTGAEFTDGFTALDEAEKAADAAASTDEKGDKFELASVLLALTLFFGGIATLFARRRFTITLLVFATVALGLGSAELAVAFAA